MANLADLSMVEAADAVRNGDATSMELLDACWRDVSVTPNTVSNMIYMLRTIFAESGGAGWISTNCQPKRPLIHKCPCVTL